MAMTDKIIERLQGFRPSFPDRLFKTALIFIACTPVLIPGAVWLGGLRIPPIPFLNGMASQPKAKAQSESPTRTMQSMLYYKDSEDWVIPGGVTAMKPPDGAVARGVETYNAGRDPVTAGRLANPIERTMANLEHGRDVYNVYCMPCHGYKGIGDGSAVGAGRLPAANSLVTDKVLDWEDGQIYHVLTVGQNTMPSYADQIPPLDRWHAVNHVRVLQRAMNPTPDDVAAYKAKKKAAEGGGRESVSDADDASSASESVGVGDAGEETTR